MHPLKNWTPPDADVRYCPYCREEMMWINVPGRGLEPVCINHWRELEMEGDSGLTREEMDATD